jgi:drug/metabolite transporter (DMT)-like permease
MKFAELRHRSHGSGGSSAGSGQQQPQKQWHHSLDDADAAGGTTIMEMTTSLLQQDLRERQPQEQLPQAIHVSRTFPPYHSNNTNSNGSTNPTSEVLFSTSTATNAAIQQQQQQQTATTSNNNNFNKDNSNNNNSSKEVFQVLGYDLSNSTRQIQFIIPTMLTFTFSLVYGYLQELIAVTICNRQLGLFLALVQFLGYTLLSYYFRSLQKDTTGKGGGRRNASSSSSSSSSTVSCSVTTTKNNSTTTTTTIPLQMYLGLSILRAIDLGMTNMAMKYINYPAKTIMKSTRVLFTMLFGILVNNKRYGILDFIIVALMVIGLAIFFHADFHTSAVFHPLGIIMLCTSLLCDGAISNFSETLMKDKMNTSFVCIV